VPDSGRMKRGEALCRLTVRLTRAQLEQMVAQAREEAPNECCGLLLGTGDAVAHVLRARNKAAELPQPRDPRRYYHVDDEAQLEAMRLERERGWEIVGIYHSHPATPAHPSATDRMLALWQSPCYVIISLANPARVDVRAFRITDRVDGNGTVAMDENRQPIRDVMEEEVVVT